MENGLLLHNIEKLIYKILENQFKLIYLKLYQMILNHIMEDVDGKIQIHQKIKNTKDFLLVYLNIMMKNLTIIILQIFSLKEKQV